VMSDSKALIVYVLVPADGGWLHSGGSDCAGSGRAAPVWGEGREQMFMASTAPWQKCGAAGEGLFRTEER
jgi:hypothetical protein